MTDSNVVNGFVFIVESPSADDLLDVRTEGRALSEALTLAQIPHRYCIASSRETLARALHERVSDAVRDFGRLPILHLSMHGSTRGVGLTNGDFVPWHELRSMMLPLLEAMKGDLLICMSACFGGYATQIAMNDDDKPPFWALVGNFENTLWADAAVAFIAFYHLFFKSFPLSQCVDAMRVASGDSHFSVHSGRDLKDNWRQRQPQRASEFLRIAAEFLQQRRQANTPDIVDGQTRT